MGGRKRISKLDPFLPEIKSMLLTGCSYQDIADRMSANLNGEIISASHVWQIAKNRDLVTEAVQDAKRRDLPHCDTCAHCMTIKSTTKDTEYRICTDLKQAIPQSCKTSLTECAKRNCVAARKAEEEKAKTRAINLFGPVAYGEWVMLNRRYGSRWKNGKTDTSITI